MGGLLYFLLVSSSKIVGFESKQDFKNTRIFTFFPFLPAAKPTGHRTVRVVVVVVVVGGGTTLRS